MADKCDNSNLAAKLDLRRCLLRRYHGTDSIRVFDCCQGSGVIWETLRTEFEVKSYWGVDVKPKAGRLRVRSERILSQPGWTENVIDIDTYGSPWKHWESMLPNVRNPVTVFMTIGQWQMGTDAIILKRLGLDRLAVPPGIACKLHDLALDYCLTRCLDYVLLYTSAVEAVCEGHARYLGLRLEPAHTSKR